VSYLRDNKVWEDEEDLNWDLIEISKVDDEIIEYLIYSLKLNSADLSYNFFIAFESLLKIGKKVERVLNTYIKENDAIHNFKVDIFNFILDFIKNKTIKDHLVPQLYNPDFIIRAKTIFKLEQAGDRKYFKYILPLLNDPDDSVRWAAMKFFNIHNMIKDPLIYHELKNHIEKESNPVIKEKMKQIFKKA